MIPLPNRYAGDKRTVEQIINAEKQGRIKAVFPAEWLPANPDMLYGAAKAGDRRARTAKKLLDSREYDKDTRS